LPQEKFGKEKKKRRQTSRFRNEFSIIKQQRTRISDGVEQEFLQRAKNPSEKCTSEISLGGSASSNKPSPIGID
jgi:hypothetical protein